MKKPHLKLEREYWGQDLLVCGVDEVGRGCLAGPVVAAAVVLPKNHKPIKNVRDSKKLTPKMRAELYDVILDCVVDFGIGLATVTEIDELGVGEATKKAMVHAVNSIAIKPDVLLIDAVEIEEVKINQRGIIKGDETIYSISASSIVAKVFRDAIVSGMDSDFPEYGFAEHKGYGTKKHYEAIAKHGLTSEHRKTFIHEKH